MRIAAAADLRLRPQTRTNHRGPPMAPSAICHGLLCQQTIAATRVRSAVVGSKMDATCTKTPAMATRAAATGSHSFRTSAILSLAGGWLPPRQATCLLAIDEASTPLLPGLFLS
jgi:hypothetical protein